MNIEWKASLINKETYLLEVMNVSAALTGFYVEFWESVCTGESNANIFD